MYFVFLIWLLILHVLRQFRPTIQKVSVRFCRRAGNSGNENSCFSDLTLWCPMHEIRIKKGKVLVSIYPPSWIGTLWFCWPDFDSWKPNLGETESLDQNMEPITSDILELLQKDSTKYVRCRELLQRVFILSISYFWQMAPLQSKCWNRKILVIPATTQNFGQPLATRYSTRYSDFLLQPYSNSTRSQKPLLVLAWTRVTRESICNSSNVFFHWDLLVASEIYWQMQACQFIFIWWWLGQSSE